MESKIPHQPLQTPRCLTTESCPLTGRTELSESDPVHAWPNQGGRVPHNPCKDPHPGHVSRPQGTASAGPGSPRASFLPPSGVRAPTTRQGPACTLLLTRTPRLLGPHAPVGGAAQADGWKEHQGGRPGPAPQGLRVLTGKTGAETERLKVPPHRTTPALFSVPNKVLTWSLSCQAFHTLASPSVSTSSPAPGTRDGLTLCPWHCIHWHSPPVAWALIFPVTADSSLLVVIFSSEVTSAFQFFLMPHVTARHKDELPTDSRPTFSLAFTNLTKSHFREHDHLKTTTCTRIRFPCLTEGGRGTAPLDQTRPVTGQQRRQRAPSEVPFAGCYLYKPRQPSSELRIKVVWAKETKAMTWV